MKKSVIENIMLILLVVIVILLGLSVINNFNHTCDKDGNGLLDKDKLENLRNPDGTYGVMKQFNFDHNGNKFNISLRLDGSVFVQKGINKYEVGNATDIMDIVYFNEINDMYNSRYYMLRKDGKVYGYTAESIIQGVQEAYLVKNVKNVNKIFNYDYIDSNTQVSVWGVMAVTDKGKYEIIAETGA